MSSDIRGTPIGQIGKKPVKNTDPAKRPRICLTKAWKPLHFRGFRKGYPVPAARLPSSQGLAPCSYCSGRRTRASSSTTISPSLSWRFVATRCGSALRRPRRFQFTAARSMRPSLGVNPWTSPSSHLPLRPRRIAEMNLPERMVRSLFRMFWLRSTPGEDRRLSCVSRQRSDEPPAAPSSSG